MSSCEFWETNILFTEHLWATASVLAIALVLPARRLARRSTVICGVFGGIAHCRGGLISVFPGFFARAAGQAAYSCSRGIWCVCVCVWGGG